MYINSYKFGEIIVDGKPYNKDIILMPDKIISNWRRSQGHLLETEDISKETNWLPSIVVIGTGKFGMMRISENLKPFFGQKGVKDIIIHKTSQAVKTYNQIESDEKAAFFHLTC